MKNLRLLALSTSYPLRDGAVSGVFVRRLYMNLPATWEITVLCPDDAIGASQQKVASVVVVPVRYAPRRWQVLSQGSGGIVAALQENKGRLLLVPLLAGAMLVQALRHARSVDLLHANWSICGVIAVIAGKLTGCPVVTTLRGDDAANAERSFVMRVLLWISIHGSDAVACVSESMAEALKRRYPRHVNRISVCLNGVDDVFMVMDRSLPSSQRLRVVAVGSLIRRKGYDVLLNAVARMSNRDQVTLHIAGEGPEREHLVSQARSLGLAEQVSFVGELPPEQIPGFLAQGDIFVMSSRSEGRPNVVLEALAAGLPVVSTMLPGVSDLVIAGENGWVVPVDDPDAMSCSLQLAYEDPELRSRMGAMARVAIGASGHAWSETGHCYDRLFRTCLRSVDGVSA